MWEKNKTYINIMNAEVKFEAYFFLGVQDSIFKAYYPNGKLAEKAASRHPDFFLATNNSRIDWQLKLINSTTLKCRCLGILL